MSWFGGADRIVPLSSDQHPDQPDASVTVRRTSVPLRPRWTSGAGHRLGARLANGRQPAAWHQWRSSRRGRWWRWWPPTPPPPLVLPGEEAGDLRGAGIMKAGEQRVGL